MPSVPYLATVSLYFFAENARFLFLGFELIEIHQNNNCRFMICDLGA